MALTKCDECGNEVSDTDKTCPKCGAKKIKKNVSKWVVWLSIVGVLYLVFMSNDTKVKREQAAASAASTLTPAERAEEKAAEEVSNKRFSKTRAVALSIKRNLREPESVQWIAITANRDASVVCLNYRARNGFGGMSVSYTTVVDNVLSETADAWNKNCLGSRVNMDYVIRVL